LQNQPLLTLPLLVAPPAQDVNHHPVRFLTGCKNMCIKKY